MPKLFDLPSPDRIADLYAAALDTDQWPDFSNVVGRAAGIENMGVWITENSAIVDLSLARVWRPLAQSYKAQFSRVDPWAQSLARAPFGKVMLGYEHLREDELVKTEFYNDFARAGGMFRPMGVRIQLSPCVFATIGSDLPWAKKRFEESDKPRLERTLPHIKRALQLRRRMQDQAWRAREGAAALDAFAFGAVICDGAGRIVFANAAAEQLSRDETAIALGGGGKSIATLAPRQSAALLSLVQDAASGGAGGVMLLTGRNRAADLIALVAPLPRQFEEGPGFRRALVVLRSARDSSSLAESSLASLFGLSPAQASIALAIYRGRSPEEIAIDRGVRISTVRTQLAGIFQRTGAESQGDLIRLVGLAPPMR